MTYAVPKSSASIKITYVKKGRRTYGGIHTVVATGHRCYIAYRKTAEIFRSGEKSISDAVRAGVACWAMDEETLIEMRAKAITVVGVFVRETGDLYMTHIANYFDRSKTKILNYETRGGALQRYLPLSHFRVRYGKMKIKTR